MNTLSASMISMIVAGFVMLAVCAGYVPPPHSLPPVAWNWQER